MSCNFVANSVHTKTLCSRPTSSEVQFYTENGRFAFLSSPLGGWGATYDGDLRLIGKHIVDFLFVLIELFSMWCKNVGTGFFRFVTSHAFDRQTEISLMAKNSLHRCSTVKNRSTFDRVITKIKRLSTFLRHSVLHFCEYVDW